MKGKTEGKKGSRKGKEINRGRWNNERREKFRKEMERI